MHLIASRLQRIAVFDEILAEEKPQIVNVGVQNGSQVWIMTEPRHKVRKYVLKKQLRLGCRLKCKICEKEDPRCAKFFLRQISVALLT